MKNLLSISDLEVSEIEDFFSLSDSFSQVQQRDIPKVPALRGKTVVLAFFENSTRTVASFGIAARRLSADVVNFSAASSSTKKGESIRDTIQTIDAMGIDAIVIRHRSSGVPQQITKWTDAAIINAGDGCHQHPTQALLDSYSLYKRFGSLKGKKIALCGDIKFSRVARSNVTVFSKLGAEVILCGPQTLLPADFSSWPVQQAHNLDDVLGDLDALYLLRLQKERQDTGLIPSLREYRSLYGLTLERSIKLKESAYIMHPGPMNRGVEIDPEVADDPRAIIEDQVANGIPVRMAVLFTLLRSTSAADAADLVSPEQNKGAL